MSRGDRQGGVALITVMVIVAIVTGIAAGMLREHQLDVRRAENVLHGNQVISHLLAAETWAREVLVQDKKDSQTDHLGESWTRVLVPVESDGGTVAGRIVDQQGLFNLNNLVDGTGQGDPVAMAQLERLVASVGGDSPSSSSVAEATVDWLDIDQDVTGLGGAEDADYAVEDPAYRSAGRHMISPTELLLVRGVSYEMWQRLQPFVSALPLLGGSRVPLNVNTAPAEVLASAVDMDLGLAQEIVEEREDSPFDTVEQFKDRIEPSVDAETMAEIDFGRFTTASDFFLVESEAQFGEVILSMRHLVLRRGQDTFVLVRALNRSW